MLRIIVSPATLSAPQRKAIADFIGNYPDETPADLTGVTAYEDEEESPEEAFATPEGVSLDKNGFPWDERIHTGSRAINANGTWKLKRGVDKALVTSVEAELKQLMSVSAPAEPTPPTVEEPASTPIAPLQPPPPPPAPPAPVVGDPYIALISRASELIGAKVIAMDQVKGIIEQAGGVSLALMKNRPDLIPQVLSAINMLAGA